MNLISVIHSKYDASKESDTSTWLDANSRLIKGLGLLEKLQITSRIVLCKKKKKKLKLFWSNPENNFMQDDTISPEFFLCVWSVSVQNMRWGWFLTFTKPNLTLSILKIGRCFV